SVAIPGGAQLAGSVAMHGDPRLGACRPRRPGLGSGPARRLPLRTGRRRAGRLLRRLRADAGVAAVHALPPRACGLDLVAARVRRLRLARAERPARRATDPRATGPAPRAP